MGNSIPWRCRRLPDPTPVPAGAFFRNEVATALVDYMEFYLLNYFAPAIYETERSDRERARRVR